MITAKAPTLTILLPVYDSTGVMRFPNSGGAYFGITCRLDSVRPISVQATAAVEEYFGHVNLAGKIEPVTAIDPVLKEEGQVSSLLYLMRLMQPSIEADRTWFPIAQVLRGLSPGSTRVAYMKAVQYLAGAAEALVHVLELDDEVRKRLKDLAGETPQSLLE